MTPDTLVRSPLRFFKRRKAWRLPVAALIVVLGGGGTWMTMHAKTSGAAGKPAEIAKDGQKTTVFELADGDVAAIAERQLKVTLPLSGSLTPVTQTTVKAKVAAVVRETLVQEGMTVAAGQVLARLDTADLQARLTQQQAALEEAQARLSLARRNAANNETLRKQNFISQNSLETTQNAVELAAANAKSVASLVEIARLALADTVIRAPIAGIVSKRHVQGGDKLSPDMPIFSIVNLARMTLEAPIPASDIPRIAIGQQVHFTVDGFQNRDFTGKVERINPTSETGSRAMLVYIAVNNSDGVLRGGMFAKGNIVTEQSKPGVPLVQLSALVNDKGRQVVYKIDNNKVVAQAVTLGLRNDDEGYAEVLSGLVKGNTVIVAKLDGVKPGSKVKLMDAPAQRGAPATVSAPATAAASATSNKG
jgi:membrane fusion protein (multidrug efflux system)